MELAGVNWFGVVVVATFAFLFGRTAATLNAMRGLAGTDEAGLLGCPRCERDALECLYYDARDVGRDGARGASYFECTLCEAHFRLDLRRNARHLEPLSDAAWERLVESRIGAERRPDLGRAIDAARRDAAALLPRPSGEPTH